METSAGAQTPSRLEDVLGAQIGSQILQLAKQAVQIESLQIALADVTKERDDLKAKADAPVLTPV